ncbi:MAG: Nif-specific transcriptional activator NifA [Deltaproteobacteria bacterium]|nr:Nif-specific transcriptional activator NifA [Deltaproteobacteria bacterium]
MKGGIQQRLALAVVSSLILAAAGISAALYFHSQRRAYRDDMRQSEQMVQAASLAFAHAFAASDEVLLDALLHELKSRDDLHIEKAYVLNREGKVIAHSSVDEYAKTYALPALLKEKPPTRLSEVQATENNRFHVLSLLQSGGQPVGLLVITFSSEHISALVRSELLWIVGISVAVLLISAMGLIVYGRRITARLQLLQTRALALGSGEQVGPVEVQGSDEISELTTAFNKMIADLAELRHKDKASSAQIETLNRELNDQLNKVVGLKEQLADENAALREELRSGQTSGDIIGATGGLREVIDQAGQLASLPVTVLIRGESGTGKELIARYLHDGGARREKPFIAVNCAALPMTLIESELFGHEKGSFTGALTQKKGKFELAHRGTLFLDEVGELPLEAQAKLLRALQQNEVVRVGGDRAIPVDVRVVAATNRNLEDEVKQGKFRDDLYYRLKVVELQCPPLRERLKDIPALAQHFVDHYSRKLGKGVVGISSAALQSLSSYRWPGNIRELENSIARGVALTSTQVLGAEDFAPLQADGKSAVAHASSVGTINFAGLSLGDLDGKSLDDFLDGCERRLIQVAMETFKTQKEAAEALSLTPVKLHRLLKKHRMIQETRHDTL